MFVRNNRHTEEIVLRTSFITAYTRPFSCIPPFNMLTTLTCLQFLLFFWNVCDCFNYAGVKFYECGDERRLNCYEFQPNERHYLVRPETFILNNTVFQNNTLLFNVIGQPGNLRDILPGTFKNLPELKHIWLGGNRLEVIRYDVFNNLPISYIYLAANNIKVIDTGAFSNLVNLIDVYLDKNQLTYFDPGWFHLEGNKSTLKILNFHHNKIRSLNKGAFYGFPNLKQIDFSFNEIQYVSGDLFNNYPSLNLFDLSFNRIVQLDAHIFHNVRYLASFVVSFNYLQTINPILLKSTFIKTVSIHPNHWLCSCLSNIEKKLHDLSIESITSDDAIARREHVLKYQLPVNTEYVSSNLSICSERNKHCDDEVEENPDDADPFKKILRKTYSKINVKCKTDTDCAEGMLCRSDYCWYLISKALFYTTKPGLMTWDTYVTL